MKKNYIDNKTILITGGTGSFGFNFTETILKNFNPKKIIIFSRDELKQSKMSEKLHKFAKKLRFFIGDVRDLERVKFALQNVDIIIHAAALKQVSTAEYNPFEFIKTNVMGTQNIVDACLASKVQRSILLSTDKAAAPVNLYGATKLVGDKIFISANNYSNKKFSVVRYGNVMMSRGSVIPKFIEQSKNKIIYITDKRMTRFSITLEQGVAFVIRCLNNMWGGELFVPKIPSYRILDVAKVFAPNAKIKYIGLLPGEKIHEEMITKTDSYNTIEFEDYYVILPAAKNLLSWKFDNFIKSSSNKKGKYAAENFSYNSLDNKEFLSPKQIKILAKNI